MSGESKPPEEKVENRIIRTEYTVTLAGKRLINVFTFENSIIDLVSYMDKSYINFGDIVKITKTEYIINQYGSRFEKFEKTEDITDKVITDTIPKIIGKRAEKINYDKLEKIK